MSTTHPSLSARLAQQRLVRGQAALWDGRRDEAIQAFRQAVAADPYHLDSLLWLAGVCADPHESMRHLTRILALDPHNAAAHEGMRWARQRLDGEPGSGQPLSIPDFVPASERMRQPRPVPAAPDASGPESRWAPPPIAVTAPAEPLAAAPRTRADGSLPRRWMTSRFATPVLAVVFGLWLVLIAAMSGVIVWLLLHPAPSIGATPVQAAPALVTLVPAASQTPMAAAVEPAVQPTGLASLDARSITATLGELDSAWAAADWERAAPLAAQAVASRPDDPDLRHKLMMAWFNRAVALMDAGELDNALSAYNQALDVTPPDPQVRSERDTLVNYLSGLSSFNQRNWPAAIQTLKTVYAADAGYLDARELLYRANYNRGTELKQKKDLAGAQKAFQAAVDLDSQAIEARGELAQVKAALAPPPPTPLPAPHVTGAKWIDVNLTTQRFRALRGDTVVYSFVTSTGETERPTTPGRYTVLDKIPNAYSRFWNLWMPYWMGIYWAGSSENGIHALPILSNGQKLWAGFLGRRVSFGCVILDTSAAKIMYDWADIGTPVMIHN